MPILARFLPALAVLAAGCALDPAGDATGLDQAEIDAVLDGAERCGDLRTGRAAVRAVDRLHSFLSAELGLKSGFAPLLAPDVIYNAPGRPLIFGRDAVLAYFDEIDPQGTMRLSWTPSRIDASIDGDFGYTFSWTETRQVQPDGSETVTPGKNIAVWRRDLGEWRVAAYQGASTALPGQPAPDGFGLFPSDTRRCAPRVGAGQARNEALDADTAFAAYSVAIGVGPAFAAFAAPDAALRPGNGWAIGPEQIAALFGPPDPDQVLDWTPLDGSAAGSADLAFTVGTAINTLHTPEGDRVFFSKYLTAWENHPDGGWLYVVDGGSAMPPPAP
jgi:ketosteroid isomerase-like protein